MGELTTRPVGVVAAVGSILEPPRPALQRTVYDDVLVVSIVSPTADVGRLMKCSSVVWFGCARSRSWFWWVFLLEASDVYIPPTVFSIAAVDEHSFLGRCCFWKHGALSSAWDRRFSNVSAHVCGWRPSVLFVTLTRVHPRGSGRSEQSPDAGHVRQQADG